MILNQTRKVVLILILLEDGFWSKNVKNRWVYKVLILILLEDGFWLCPLHSYLDTTNCLNPYSTGRWFLMRKCKFGFIWWWWVLILILLEDGFWLGVLVLIFLKWFSLNPYSTGRWFLITECSPKKHFQHCLNPYSTGRWFLMCRVFENNKPKRYKS